MIPILPKCHAKYICLISVLSLDNPLIIGMESVACFLSIVDRHDNMYFLVAVQLAGRKK